MYSSLFKPEIMTIISAVGAGGSFYYAFTTARKIEKSVQELVDAQRQFKDILTSHDNYITTYERKIEIINTSLDRLKDEFKNLSNISSGSSDIEAMAQIFDQIVQDMEEVNKNIPQELRKIRKSRKKKISKKKNSKKKKSKSSSKKRNKKEVEEESESESSSEESSESESESDSDSESSSEEEVKKKKSKKSKKKKEKELPKKTLPGLNRKIEVSTFNHSSKNNEGTDELDVNPSDFFSQYD